jgi:acyl-CoA synthetase (AMP-forming)/AMP-acid ligase II
MTNVEELAESSPIGFLLQRFAEKAGHTAFVCEGRELSYAWLLDQIRAWLSYVKDAHIGAGQVVALTGDYSPEVCSLLLSLVHTRTIVVPFASVSGGEKAQLARIARIRCSPRSSRDRCPGSSSFPRVRPEHPRRSCTM